MWRTSPGSTTCAAVALILAAVCASYPTSARQQSGVFRAATRTVPVYTTVIGPDGRLVTDLGRDDFQILDDGKPQPITVFDSEIQPISIVVMLDTSGSMSGNIGLLRDASVQLFTHLMPADKARVGNFGDRITVSPRFTNDTNELIRWVWTDMDIGGPTPLWGAINVGMTALQHVDGRRVVLVFTDGRDASNRQAVTLRDVTARAQAEEFMIYGIGMWSRGGYGGRGGRGGRGPAGFGPTGGGMGRGEPPDPGLKTLAEESGGGYFELVNADNLGPTFAHVAEELHQQYLLGFAAERLDGRLHALEVRVRQPGLTARARRSYLARAVDGRHP